MSRSVIRLLSAIFLLLAPTPGIARALATGSIEGTVVDAETGETLIGVNVFVVELGTGTISDYDGRYRIRGLPPGTYTLSFSYISHATRTVAGVEVGEGAATELDVAMTPESIGLDEVVVEARALKNIEATLLRMQARSPVISDGITAQQIRRSPDSNSGDVLKRVTGVTIIGGRFAYVRGIPERYNATLLNGSSVASTEPDRRAFAFDMLPANLLDNVIVVKSATPNLPGDFSGGLLQLNTISYPEQFTFGLSYSNSYSPGVTFQPFSSPAAGGRWDWLGIDAGARKLPASFPRMNLSRMNGDSLSAMQGDLANMLPNTWAQHVVDAPLNTSLSVSAGNSVRITGTEIGLVGALTYRNGYQSASIVRREVETGDDLRFDYAGSQHAFAVNWGGLFNLSVRPSPRHSFSFKNLYSRSVDDEVTSLEGNHYESGFDQYIVGMRYLARDVYTGQISGEHAFGSTARLLVRWDAFLNSARRNEPDYRRLTYNREIGSTEDRFASIFYDVRIGTGGRFFSDLDEVGRGGNLHLTLPIGRVNLMGGGFLDSKHRVFHTRLLGAATPRRGFDFDLLRQPLNIIFDQENFGPGKFMVAESSTGTGNYDADQDVAGSYLMTDLRIFPISSKLRLAGGVRFEQSIQRMNSVSFSGDSVRVRHRNGDVLPSATLTYALTDVSNIRVAYSRNVNRPELRELAPYAYYDFEVQTTIYGNPELRQATIQNFDLRLECYPGIGRMLSASIFYKRFRDAIERVVVPGVALNAERTFANADHVTNYGVELEARYGLRFLGRLFRESSVSTNYTRVHSNVTVKDGGHFLPRTGRPLQGQAPYVLNAGLNLVEPHHGGSISLLYNRFGTRIVDVASAFEDDVMEQPRHVVDLVVTQPINGHYELRFAARDILAREQRFTQAGTLVRKNEISGTYSLGLSIRY